MCFKMKMPNMQIPQVTTTARDIVSEREAKAPESPIFGDDSSTNFVDIAKKKGVGALQIKPKTDSYNPVNNYFNK